MKSYQELRQLIDQRLDKIEYLFEANFSDNLKIVIYINL